MIDPFNAAIGSLILSLIIAVGICLTLDLQTYIESGGLASTVIYYVFTFVSFESILGVTNGLISTPVEEGPVERITEGLQRGGKTRWKLFYIQIFTCLAGLSCPESQRRGIIFIFGHAPNSVEYPTFWYTQKILRPIKLHFALEFLKAKTL